MRAIWPAQGDGGWRSTSQFSAENCTHQKSNSEHEENAWLLRSQHFFDVFDMLCRLGWTNPRLSKLWTCHTKRISNVMTIYHTKNDGSFSKRDFWILRNMGNIVHVHHIFRLPRKQGIRMGDRLKPTAANDSNTQKIKALRLPRGWDSIRFPAFFNAERRPGFKCFAVSCRRGKMTTRKKPQGVGKTRASEERFPGITFCARLFWKRDGRGIFVV